MNVFNRRNALVGFLALKALERRRRRQRVGRGLKIALFVVLGIVSVGVLAGIAAAFLRQRGEVEELLEEADAAAEEAAEDVAAELDAASAEPIPTT
jgi:nucleotide-binding universal stress UspA family protein